MLKLHNTLSRQVQDFNPMESDKVSLYTCGPTVYNYLQIGNWVAYIRWDTLVRTLHLAGYNTERVMNITDVGHLVSDSDEGEDKMQKGARREGVTAWDVAKRYTDDFLEGMQKLNLITPEHITKATEFIPQQIALVQTLQEKGYTYQTSDGIYFDTSKFPGYADFAKLDLEGQEAGSRVAVNDEKRNPHDFALWKFSPKDEKRDMEWDSPWGTGFPGWHLECSAMAMDKLGETIDIHTGGIDHIPVHHTNEIAQSEAATGKQFANYWLHANFLMVNGTKISKSLGNGYTLQDLEKKGFSPLDFRMFTLQSHYRTESNFTWDNLSSAKNRLNNWRNIAELRHQTIDPLQIDDGRTDETLVSFLQATQAAKDALLDDLNTPQALAIIEEALSIAEKQLPTSEQVQAFTSLISFIDDTLGLRLIETTPDITDLQKELIHKRETARIAKDWSHSDELRIELQAQGIYVRDTAQGTVWARSSPAISS